MSKEGRRIRSGAPMDAVAPFIMPSRVGAANTFSASVDVEKCEQLLREKRLEGMKSLGMIHIFMAAYIRVASQLPGINRFIRGQRVYARKGMEICMAIKKEMKLNAPETVIKLDAVPTDTLYRRGTPAGKAGFLLHSRDRRNCRTFLFSFNSQSLTVHILKL